MKVDILATGSEIQTELDFSYMQEAIKQGYTYPYFLDAGVLVLSKVDIPVPAHAEIRQVLDGIRASELAFTPYWVQKFGGVQVMVHYRCMPTAEPANN